MRKNDLTLLILAAGMGSRYGGLKQLEPLGPSGEILIDYSFYDALHCGFDKIVCVIRRDIETSFREKITEKWQNRVEVIHAFQELHDLPEGYSPGERTKPWGTVHAILAAERVIASPFVVINADDFYGRSTFRILADFLRHNPTSNAMVSFVLGNTLSRHGHVSRGICSVDGKGMLRDIIERQKIFWQEDDIVCREGDDELPLAKDAAVSMNFWGFSPAIFPLLRKYFAHFLQRCGTNPKEECLIPEAIDHLIKSRQISVRVLQSTEKWMGVTYQEDKQQTQRGIEGLIEAGQYPFNLWQSE